MLRSLSNPSLSPITTVVNTAIIPSGSAVPNVQSKETRTISCHTHQNNSQSEVCFLYILLEGICSCGDAWGHAQAEAFTSQVRDTGGECTRCERCVPGCWLQDIWRLTGLGKLHQKTPPWAPGEPPQLWSLGYVITHWICMPKYTRDTLLTILILKIRLLRKSS